MTYSHRNGETELPTVAGWFWLKGGITDDWQEEMFVLVRKERSKKVEWRAYTVAWEPLLLAELQGQWWGPVQAPWESDA